MDSQPPHYYPKNDDDGGSQSVERPQLQVEPQRGKPVRNQYLDTTPESTANRKQTSTAGQDFFSSGHELLLGFDMNNQDNISNASGVTLGAPPRAPSSPTAAKERDDAPDEWLGTDPKLDNGYVARYIRRVSVGIEFTGREGSRSFFPFLLLFIPSFDTPCLGLGCVRRRLQRHRNFKGIRER